MIQVAEPVTFLTRLGGPRNAAGLACLAACGLWVLGFGAGVVGLALITD